MMEEAIRRLEGRRFAWGCCGRLAFCCRGCWRMEEVISGSEMEPEKRDSEQQQPEQEN